MVVPFGMKSAYQAVDFSTLTCVEFEATSFELLSLSVAVISTLIVERVFISESASPFTIVSPRIGVATVLNVSIIPSESIESRFISSNVA